MSTQDTPPVSNENASETEQARRVLEEYANELRAMLEKLRNAPDQPATVVSADKGGMDMIFICPRTGMKVQHRQEASAADNDYEVVTCPACARLHFVNRKTGKLLGHEAGHQGARRPDVGPLALCGMAGLKCVVPDEQRLSLAPHEFRFRANFQRASEKGCSAIFSERKALISPSIRSIVS